MVRRFKEAKKSLKYKQKATESHRKPLQFVALTGSVWLLSNFTTVLKVFTAVKPLVSEHITEVMTCDQIVRLWTLYLTPKLVQITHKSFIRLIPALDFEDVLDAG